MIGMVVCAGDEVIVAIVQRLLSSPTSRLLILHLTHVKPLLHRDRVCTAS
ncbi:unnamed protein product [Fusarium graminearum]|uniref:Uncharacterized protein n=1 Tax=Gibberella zeae (strain ATCC MYA-4620 / CBS 123657 / FGSC 9075 / NRRL 31084 / PH-1) TaxID=229533 RepID=A0A098DST6_GIBZE|nr:unnamed protein product [Fusarium graminearum]